MVALLAASIRRPQTHFCPNSITRTPRHHTWLSAMQGSRRVGRCMGRERVMLATWSDARARQHAHGDACGARARPAHRRAATDAPRGRSRERYMRVCGAWVEPKREGAKETAGPAPRGARSTSVFRLRETARRSAPDAPARRRRSRCSTLTPATCRDLSRTPGLGC